MSCQVCGAVCGGEVTGIELCPECVVEYFPEKVEEPTFNGEEE